MNTEADRQACKEADKWIDRDRDLKNKQTSTEIDKWIKRQANKEKIRSWRTKNSRG